MASKISPEQALASWKTAKDGLRASILTDATAHALVTVADTVIEALTDNDIGRWTRLRKSVQADLALVQEGDLTIGNNYAMLDVLKGVIAKMDALEPGGAWYDDQVRLAQIDYACGVPTGGDSTCRRVI